MFSLQSEHTDKSVTWDFMARRELEVGGAPELHSAQSRAADIMSREERCSAVYEEGLKNLNTGNIYCVFTGIPLRGMKTFLSLFYFVMIVVTLCQKKLTIFKNTL